MRRVFQPYALTLMSSVLSLMNVDMRTHPRAVLDALAGAGPTQPDAKDT